MRLLWRRQNGAASWPPQPAGLLAWAVAQPPRSPPSGPPGADTAAALSGALWGGGWSYHPGRRRRQWRSRAVPAAGVAPPSSLPAALARRPGVAGRLRPLPRRQYSAGSAAEATPSLPARRRRGQRLPAAGSAAAALGVARNFGLGRQLEVAGVGREGGGDSSSDGARRRLGLNIVEVPTARRPPPAPSGCGRGAPAPAAPQGLLPVICRRQNPTAAAGL